MKSQVFNLSLKIIGIALLILTLVGEYRSFPDVRSAKGVFKNDSKLSYTEYTDICDSLYELKFQETLSDFEFLEKLTKATSDRFLHRVFKNEKEIRDYGQSVRLSDNWILYIISRLFLDHKDYFYHDVNSALKRGIGQCGQQAHTLMNMVENYGFQAYTIGLTGHVITGVNLNGGEVLCDPDYGVFIPKSLDEVSRTDIEKYYTGHMSYTDTLKYYLSLNDLCSIYLTKDDNWNSKERTVTIGKKYIYMEEFAVSFKWILPFSMIFIAFYSKN